LIIEILELVNSTIPTEMYENAAQEILDFETDLSKVYCIFYFNVQLYPRLKQMCHCR